MVEIVARRCGWMIGVRMIIADYSESAVAGVVIGALVLLGRYQIASLSRLPSFILGRMYFGKKVCFLLTLPKQEAATLIRVSLLSMTPYLI
jgi:hypothetical protein